MNFVFLSAILTYLVSMIASAENKTAQMSFNSTQLTPSMYMLEGSGANITASIGPDGVFLVDDDFAEMSGKLTAKIRELGGESIKFIVNTHFHYDHTGGNENFSNMAIIIAATSVRDRLMTSQKLWGKIHPPALMKALPVMTFDDSITLHFNGEKIRIVHLRHGHTDGDSIAIFEKSKVVSMGDLYFSGMYPIFHPEHKGSLEGFIRDIKVVINEIPDDAKIVPGHGPLSTKKDLQNYLEMIEISAKFVKDEMQKGHSLIEIQKMKVPQKLIPFSTGYLKTSQWLALVFNGIEHK